MYFVFLLYGWDKEEVSDDIIFETENGREEVFSPSSADRAALFSLCFLLRPLGGGRIWAYWGSCTRVFWLK